MNKGLIYAAEVLVILFVGIALGALYHAMTSHDGLDDWRRPDGAAVVEVVFDGETYYCEHAESPAGYPGRLLLYRNGGRSYLSLPDKFSVTDPAPEE